MVGGRRTFFIAAGERRVDVHAGQCRHGFFAIHVGLLTEGQLGGRGGAGGLLWDENSHEEGHDHGAGPQEEGRTGDESSLRGAQTEKQMFVSMFQLSSSVQQIQNSSQC